MGLVGNLPSTGSRHSGFATGRMDAGETPALPGWRLLTGVRFLFGVSIDRAPPLLWTPAFAGVTG